jgi:hypothetical protein
MALNHLGGSGICSDWVCHVAVGRICHVHPMLMGKNVCRRDRQTTQHQHQRAQTEYEIGKNNQVKNSRTVVESVPQNTVQREGIYIIQRRKKDREETERACFNQNRRTGHQPTKRRCQHHMAPLATK